MAFDLYQSTPARRFLMGNERTINPNPAAAYLLGKARVSAYRKRYAYRKSAHRGNPAPAAIIAGLSGIKKLFNLGGSPRVFNDLPGGGPLQTTVNDLLLKASQGDAAAIRTMWAARTGKQGAAWTKIWAEMVPGVVPKAVQDYIKRNLDPTFAVAGSGLATMAGSAAINPQLLAAGTTVAATVGRQLVQSATRSTRGRARKARQVVRYDPETGDKYRVSSESAEAASWPSRKPSARSLAGVGGAAAAAAPVAAKAGGLAAAGGAAVAGVVIGGLAVGAIIGTLLRKAFGTARAVRAEEAAVEGAIALREERAALESRLGRKLTQPEVKKLFDVYVTKLQGLGFVQDAKGMWHRPRSFTERLLG